MDFSEIINSINLNVYAVVAGLVVGYLLKNYMPADNKIIPTVVTVLGAVIAVLMGGLCVESVVGGAFSGLISTGMYELFAQYIKHPKAGGESASNYADDHETDDPEDEDAEDEKDNADEEKEGVE